MSSPSPSTLSTFFTHPSKARPSVPRLAVSLEALDKCGKSHWAINTTPDPVALIVVNDNTYVYDKAIKAGRKVHLMEVSFPDPNMAVRKSSDVNDAQHKIWIDEWVRFKNGMKAVVADKSIRTVVWDTASELWHLAELAHFGKLTGNARIDLRTILNDDYSKVFWSAYKQRPDLNMVLIHRHKKQYVPLLDATGKVVMDDNGKSAKTEWNGKYERIGYNQTGFNVDITLQCGWDGNRKCFFTRIDQHQATRYGGELTGKTWYGDDSGFANLALEVFPETEMTPEIWGL